AFWPRRRTSGAGAMSGLAANAEAFDQLLVARFVDPLHVIEERPAGLHKLEQAAAGMMVLAVALEMLGEVGDAFRKDRDLDLRRTGIPRLGGIFGDERGFALGSDRHRLSLELEG